MVDVMRAVLKSRTHRGDWTGSTEYVYHELSDWFRKPSVVVLNGTNRFEFADPLIKVRALIAHPGQTDSAGRQ